MSLLWATLVHMEGLVLPVALLTDVDGARLVEVVEVDGAILERDSGAPVAMVDVVVVLGLEPVAA